jgi:hypothetical protein
MVKQHRYMPIMARLKRLYLSEETAKQMRWHKEGKCDSEDPDIMSHHADTEACQRMVFNLTARPAVRMLAGQFLSCL